VSVTITRVSNCCKGNMRLIYTAAARRVSCVAESDLFPAARHLFQTFRMKFCFSWMRRQRTRNWAPCLQAICVISFQLRNCRRCKPRYYVFVCCVYVFVVYGCLLAALFYIQFRETRKEKYKKWRGKWLQALNFTGRNRREIFLLWGLGMSTRSASY
jgi:hypothetical protein